MNLVNEGVLPPDEPDDRDERREEMEMAQKRETVADIVAELRNKTGNMYDCTITTDEEEFHSYADRIEAAWKRERELLRSCARWILTHDIYGHMAQELLAECKKVLGDDGKFLMPKGDMV